MSEPIDPGRIFHEVLVQQVVQIGSALRELHDGFEQHNSDPRQWPRTAAMMQFAGPQLAELGEQLANSLARYAEEHPEIEVPEDGPAVIILREAEHREFWNVAGELHDTSILEEAVAAYADVLEGEYGRPELDVRAVALDDQGAVMVLQYLTAQGPDAVVQVYIGGWDLDDHKRIDPVLAEHGITTGDPRFWPPPLPDRTFWSLPGEDGLFDAFGRRVGSPAAQDTGLADTDQPGQS